MNTKVEKIENNVVKIEVTVPAETFKAAMKKSYEKNAARFSVPGFRKGKAPMSVIEKYYGEGVFYEDAINFAVEETYPKAIEENNITPVDYPELDVIQIGKDIDLIYSAKVTVKPEVKLGQYKGVEASKISYLVTDEDVESEINMLKEKNARIITKENGTIEKGDTAVIDFEGFIDGTPFEGGKGENYELVIGSGTFIPGFEDQLVGAKTGETVDVNVTFPEDYHAEELKGKPALFKVTVHEIKAKEYPVVDDEFAKEVSEFDTLDELKADLRKKLEEQNGERAKREFEDQVIAKVVESSEVEIPEAMVNQEIDYMIKDMDYRLRYQGLNIDQYTQMMGITMDHLRSDLKEMATSRVKTGLVLEAIAKAENITATEEEINERAEEIAKRYGTKDVEKMKSAILESQRTLIAEEIVNNKVIDLVVKKSNIIG
ncbi:Trigger factor [Caloramator mitchellensis]|uniref:Trigger factor n=1 Tax=Caloramator mitchellensis TaxID=908809 RepID=A0A0R3JY54_CALMK|nr:trigger factor [Caloramator mitchellensis]KRQ86142.1 Trigger factor [Caloramator mitchellensis]